MSYILDALRRADAERDRGGIPSLNAKPMSDVVGDDDVSVGRATMLRWGLVGLLLVVIAVLAWQLLRRGEPIAGAMTPSPAAPLDTAPVSPPQLVPSDPPLATFTPPARPLRPPEPPAPAPTVTPAPGVESRVVALNELPEALRRELPQMSVGGATYSKDASNRMLILNGQVFREGGTVANGLVLEEIRLKSAVFSYKGYRYSMSF